MATLEKQPSESRVYDIDFSANLDDGETLSTISSLTVSPVTSPALTKTNEGIASSGRQVTFRLAAGAGGSTYKITAVVTTSNGNTLEGEGTLNVFDR